MGGSRLIYEDTNREGEKHQSEVKLQDRNTRNLEKRRETFTHHKEHLPLILVRQQEESQHGGVGNLVVESFTVQVEECRIDPNIISVRIGQKRNERKGKLKETHFKSLFLFRL